MNRTEFNPARSTLVHRMMPRAMLCGVVAAMVAGPLALAHAGDDYYINNAVVIYPGTADYPPTIDATNFVNNSSFTVEFTTGTVNPGQTLYETWDTVNYTNYGLLMCNTGFRFDNQNPITSNHSRSGTFFNAGTVSCSSANNFSDPFFGQLALEGLAQCIIDATNIIIPGEVDTGEFGLIQLHGQNIDASRSILTIEGNVPTAGASTVFGLNTTNGWDPVQELRGKTNYSTIFQGAPFQFFVTNALTYVNTAPGPDGTNIIRVVFLQDDSDTNVVTSSVYFGFPPFQNGTNLGFGDVTIQWAGANLDPASGLVISNFLYLNDDYVLGASTNILPIVGVPANFKITESQAPFNLSTLTLAPGLPLIFTPFSTIFTPDNNVTNYYVYANMDLEGSFSTNSLPNHNVTNLPGRVEFVSDKNLDLTLSEVTGQNYTRMVATNQFHGSAGAFIQTPFADLNLGVTNGYLVLTNTMEANVPFWGGTITAWNTRWIDSSLSNDFRVLIVRSKLVPQFAAQVQDLNLHGSNSIILSDTYNVMRTFNADCRSLTLTTNPVGFGATSFEGELNLQTSSIFWQSSVPNLRFLTNNGAIRMQNLALFGNPLLTNVTLTAASGTLSETGTNAVRKDKVTVGTNVYMFTALLTNSVANQVLINVASFDATLTNLIAAINGTTGSGTVYSTATKPHPSVSAGPLMSHNFTVTALTPGTSGNSIATTFTAATGKVNMSWGGHATLFGGGVTTNVVPFYTGTAFINNGLFFDEGSIIYSGNFESGDVVSNGVGGFQLFSLNTTLTNGFLQAGADVSITTTNLITSNLVMIAGRSLTLQVTNLLTDTGPSPTNASFWSVGQFSVGSGLNLPVKPVSGDLLGTTLTLTGPTNRVITDLWAGQDRGLSAVGYTNNEAIGRFVMNTISPQFGGHNAVFKFTGTGVSNALYIDTLILTNFSSQGNATNLYNFPWLSIDTNMFIYFAQALLTNGISVAENIDKQSKNGANNGRLRWIYSYAGYYSSTNIIYPDGSTNTFNTALAQSSSIDSDGDGIPNNLDPTPFFVPSEYNFSATVTNVPPMMIRIQWTTIPDATNFVCFSTNMSGPWLPFTNFNNWYFGNNVARTNAAHVNHFISPQVYMPVMGVDNSQQTNVWVLDTITNVPHYYKVLISPWLDRPE